MKSSIIKEKIFGIISAIFFITGCVSIVLCWHWSISFLLLIGTFFATIGYGILRGFNDTMEIAEMALEELKEERQFLENAVGKFKQERKGDQQDGGD